MVRAGLILATMTVAVGTAPAAAVRLDGPEVYKLDWSTRAVSAADVDGDGRVDLALANNATGRIELLLQRSPGQADRAADRRGSTRGWEPRLEDTRFERESLVTGVSVFDLAAGDLDGDGRTDLAYTSEAEGLTVRHRDAGGAWQRRRVLGDVEPSQWSSSLVIVDVDGDDRDELIVLGQRELRVYARDAAGRLGDPRRYPLADPGCYGLAVERIDEDDLADLVYLVPRNEEAWRVRFQRPDGGFGPERSFRVPTPRRTLVPIRTDGRRAFASVDARSGLIEFRAIERRTVQDAVDGVLSLRVYSLPTEANGSQAHALGDLDGDGDLDFVVGDRRGARVWCWAQDAGGVFVSPTSFPSLSDIRSVTTGDVDGDGRDELIVVSPGERLIGLSRMRADGRLSYPEPLIAERHALAAAAVDLDGDGRVELAWLETREGRRRVVVHARGENGAWTERQVVELAEMRTDPFAIESLDADQDGRAELAVFTLQSPLRLLRERDDGSWVEVSADGLFRRGLVDDLLPGGLTNGDVDGDGRDELIVAGTGFARALRLTAAGRLEVVDQFNADRSDAAVAATFVVDVDGDGANEVLLVLSDTHEIAVLARDPRGVYRQRSSIPIAPIEVVDTQLTDLASDGEPDLVLVGRDRFWTAPAGHVDLEVRTLSSRESDLDELSYVELAAGDLDGDGTDELVALDSGQSHILQVLARTDADGWQSVLHFPVFESDPHYQGRQGARAEPREMLLADVTSDGLPDLVLLVHDRLLVYPARAGGSSSGSVTASPPSGRR